MSKVMLIEDDPTMLSLLNTLLEIEGYEVASLKGFGNIIEDIHTQNPDIILMDVNLQGVNGIKVLEEIRKDNKIKDVKIIMSSGMDFSHESLSKGANDFLLKPYMPDELIDKIKRQLNS